MSVDEGDARVQRLKRSCEIKRMNYVKKIRAIHKLAIQSAEDTSVVPQLLVMVETLDQLLSSFTIEDEALLGHLLDLGLENEYPDTEGVEIFELVCSAKATANRFMQYCPDKTIESTRGGSQVSLNNAGRGVPTSDEQSIPDNVVVDVSPGGVQSNNAGSLGSNKAAAAHFHGYKQQSVKGNTVVQMLQWNAWSDIMPKVQRLDARNA
ncbi:hypothetical protein ACI65C_000812 [Semiaphis heraclei]